MLHICKYSQVGLILSIFALLWPPEILHNFIRITVIYSMLRLIRRFFFEEFDKAREEYYNQFKPQFKVKEEGPVVDTNSEAISKSDKEVDKGSIDQTN